MQENITNFGVGGTESKQNRDKEQFKNFKNVKNEQINSISFIQKREVVKSPYYVYLELSSLADMLLQIRREHEKGVSNDLRVIIGPPGTGKTFGITRALETLKNIKGLEEKSEEIGEKDLVSAFNSAINNLKEIIEKSDIFDYGGRYDVKEVILSNLSSFDAKAINILRDTLGAELTTLIKDDIKKVSEFLEYTQNLSRKAKENESGHTIALLSGLVLILKDISNRCFSIKENNEEPLIKEFINSLKDMDINIIVLPSLDRPNEFLGNYVYTVNPKSLLEKELSLPILRIVKNSLVGKPSVLILDELSELPKIKSEGSVKKLHPFFDSIINEEPITIQVDPSLINNDEKEFLKVLINELKEFRSSDKFNLVYSKKEKKEEFDTFVSDLESIINRNEKEIIQLNIPLSDFFYVIGTGNERDESDILGFFRSTKRRFSRIYVGYLPPSLINHFIDEKADYLLKQMKGDDKRAFNKFTEELKLEYNILYSKFYKNSAESDIRHLPSIRTITHAMETYALFLLEKEVINKYMNENVEDVIGVSANMLPGYRNIDINRYEVEGKFITEEEFAEFLITLLHSNSMVKTGSYTFLAETERSDEMEKELGAKIADLITNKMQIAFGEGYDKIYKVRMADKYHYYNKFMLNYVAYIYLMLIKRKPFTILYGVTSEGKTSLVKSLANYLSKKRKVEFIFGLKPDEFALRTANLRREEGNKKENLEEPQLLTWLRKIKNNPDTIYIILVDEIDNAKYTQQLNSLLQGEEVVIDGEPVKFNNLVIFGTMNVSEEVLDNFWSRSGLSLLFFPELSDINMTIKKEGRSFSLSMVSYLMIRDKMNKIMDKMDVSNEDRENIIRVFDEVVLNEGPSLSKTNVIKAVSSSKFLGRLEGIIRDKKRGKVTVEDMELKFKLLIKGIGESNGGA